jgi:hypothetical protein
VPPWGTATNVASSWFCTGVESLEPWPNLSTLQYRLVDWEMMAQLPRGSASGFWQVWSMQGLFHTAQTHCRCVYICRLSLAPSKKEPCFSVCKMYIRIYIYVYIHRLKCTSSVAWHYFCTRPAPRPALQEASAIAWSALPIIWQTSIERGFPRRFPMELGD